MPLEVDTKTVEGLTRLFQFGIRFRSDDRDLTRLSSTEGRLGIDPYYPASRGALEDTVRYLESLGHEGRFEKAYELIGAAIGHTQIKEDDLQKTLLRLTTQKSAVRFSFSKMILLCLRHTRELQIAQRMKFEVRFSGVGPEVYLMAMAALFLEVPIYVESGPPWNPDALINGEPDTEPPELEVTFPPTGFTASNAPELDKSVRKSGLPRAVDRGKYDLESVMMNYLSLAEPEALALVSHTFATSPKQSRLRTRQNLLQKLRIRRITELSLSSPHLIAIETTASDDMSEQIRMGSSASQPEFDSLEFSGLVFPGKSTSVSIDEIKAAGSLLSPRRYLAVGPTGGNSIGAVFKNSRTPPKHKLIQLFKIIRPKTTKKDPNGEFAIKELRPSDISERGDLSGSYREIQVRKGTESNLEPQKLRRNDVVFAHRGSIGRVCYITDDDIEQTDLWAAQSLLIFRARKQRSGEEAPPYCDPRILFMYLLTSKVQDTWSKLAIGDRSPAIPIGEIERFALPDRLLIKKKLKKSQDNRYDPVSPYGQLRDAYNDWQATLRAVRELEEKLNYDREKVWDISWPPG
ncbi:hypothetical protein Q4555_14390 [Octadecabacter sp. 1_MG-2023]|uniref:hypothetical protein n=1 Tax=unclassified Octadecabacter TaxID=196158 RepID=UPI001C092CA4|nr:MULTISPECIES: hypothetical protein [unclassified Octadecabacter]MBU2991890.1 hypothetical protein [Octadecabacter sp. B2R22]MDO6735864.1 hypothetical protein [Octadecabacter sp. 1_MG-2023]